MKNNNLKLKINESLFTSFKFLLVIFTFSFLIFNFVASQNISSLYFQLAEEDRVAVVNFLSKIKNLPSFNSFLQMNKNIYGNSLAEDVFAESVKRKQSIKEYELLLQKNLLSRDVLFNLYLLYQADGNQIKAEEFLDRAKKIDPSLK